ncbi:MAG: hypothetical protein KDK36_20615 [Leptospiraceae bacterium]|nr:hypothetical protein [Leptospiraceae bacterium]
MTEEEFVITRADGSEIVVKGYVPDFVGDAKVYEPGEFEGRPLPRKVDLRKYMTEVENQSQSNSCTANSVAGAYEYLAKRYLGEDSYDVSRLFIYYIARKLGYGENAEIEDKGSSSFYAIKGLEKYGACSEETWPFDLEKINEEPSEEAYEEAANFLVEDYAYVPVNLDLWKSCLAEGNPIIFGVKTYKSFSSHRKKGLVPVPSPKEAQAEKHGRHAMLCVGYSDKEQVFIVRNSWGSDWGDNGYCYIPYSYVMDKDKNNNNCWIIERLEDIPIDEDLWFDEEDASVLEEIDTELANMSEEEYNDMLDDMGDHPLEYRIGLIILKAAGADGELSEEEYDSLSEYMDKILEELGSEYEAKKILKFCNQNEDNEDLLEESVSLLGKHLSNSLLAQLTQDIEAIAGVDDLSEDENDFLNYLVDEWQINSEENSEENEDEDSEDDEEEEEDSEEDSGEQEESPEKGELYFNDAFQNMGNKKIYFFSDNQYFRYDLYGSDKVDSDYPKEISENWNDLPFESIDAVFQRMDNGKVYFFSGNEYVRYDMNNDCMDEDYPREISENWNDLPFDSIDAAFHKQGTSKVYFFSGTEYARYDLNNDCMDEDYPKEISEAWNLPFDTVDMAFQRIDNNIVYMFCGDEYVRYNLSNDTTDKDEPDNFYDNWYGF